MHYIYWVLSQIPYILPLKCALIFIIYTILVCIAKPIPRGSVYLMHGDLIQNWKTFLMACLCIMHHINIIYIYTDYLQDYKGQKLAEQIFQGIILVSAVSKMDSTFTAITTLSFVLCLTSLSLQVIGFIYGLFIQQFGWTVYIMLAGFTVSCLVCRKTSVCLM